MARRKTARQLEREIAASLSARGEPGLAAMFADPEARKVFAREMRFEIQKQQLARVTAASQAARPYTVKHLERFGDRRIRSLVGHYATKQQASAKADAVDGWVEHGGRVVYGTEQQSDPAG